MKTTTHRLTAHVLGVDVDILNMQDTLTHLHTLIRDHRKGYICVTGVHGIMEAQRDSQLLEVYAGSEMTVPDGMPLVWVGRTQGHAAMQRVTGPDLMLEIFRRDEFAHATHFFYGGAEGIAQDLRKKLIQRFPWAKIVGTYTPPFRDLSLSEQEQFAATISELKPDIIWVGISCPRQEIFMSRMLPLLETKLMFGVGAAFDYHTGHIKDSPEWVKKSGLQWLHRLVQDPKRLWRRYLRNNPAFIGKIALQILKTRRNSVNTAAHARSTWSTRKNNKVVTID